MEPEPKRPFRVSIEGNIGAGKSTLIDYFSQISGIETYGVSPLASLSRFSRLFSPRNQLNFGGTSTESISSISCTRISTSGSAFSRTMSSWLDLKSKRLSPQTPILLYKFLKDPFKIIGFVSWSWHEEGATWVSLIMQYLMSGINGFRTILILI